MHVNDRIYMIVFGESTLNDAVAIALADSAENVRDLMGHGTEPDYLAVSLNSVVHFFVFFFGSVIIGCLLSIFTSLLFMKLELENLIWLETGLFLQCAYMPYIIAEACNCSGILAILIAGITMRNYAFYSLSGVGQVTIEHLIEAAGYI